MKRFLVILLVFGILLLAGCSVQDSSESTKPSAIDIPDSFLTDAVPQTDSEESKPENSEHEESVETTSVSDRTETTAASDEGASMNSADKKSKSEIVQNESLPLQSKDNGDSAVSKNSTDYEKNQETAHSQTTQIQEEPAPKQDDSNHELTEQNATAADCKAVAEQVLKYINQYRLSTATKLSGLTGYAEYRSRQLVSNFAHDTADQRAAATALQYGEYIDPSLYGGSGDAYYRANAREAIAKAGYVGTVDTVARQLASLVRNSQGHWNYIGSSEYTYIGVGVTYESGMWYCTIAVTTQNTDEL